MVFEKAYLQIRRLSDPAYFVYENTDTFFVTIKIVEIVMLTLYLVYFLIVSYLVLFVLNMMKKAYRYLILLTLVVIASSLLILFLNGRTSQLVNTPLYLSQYVLFNTYMFMVAFFYSPTTEAIPPVRGGRSNIELAVTSFTEMFDRANKTDNKHSPAGRNDRSTIMSRFYETEMPELTKSSDLESHRKAFDQSVEDEDDLESFNTTGGSKRRRDLKRSSQDKAKERLWQEIEQEVSSQADSSDSSDEEHQI